MEWGDHVLKLVEVMQRLQYEMNSTIYSSLLSVLTKQYGNLETAYNILGNLPTEKAVINNNHNNNRRNSLMMNCDVKPERGRKKYYETIQELQNRFSATFPGRSIMINQECPFCECAVHDVHIRIGWSSDDRSVSTQCPECGKHFDAKFLVKELEEYEVKFDDDVAALQSLEFFRMRGANDTFVEHISFESTATKMIKVGDQIMAINGCAVTDQSMSEIYELLKHPPPPPHMDDANHLHLPSEIESSVSSSNYSDNLHEHAGDQKPLTQQQLQQNKLKKQSTKSKLMKLMKLSKEKNDESPVCITFRRAVLCPYFSPLILYREIKKVMQNHALLLNQKKEESKGSKTRGSVNIYEEKTNGDDVKQNEENKSYRKQRKKTSMDAEKEAIKIVLQQSGISAISSIDFRMKHCELFWNLSWHFSNLRLPIHFLQNAFDEDSNEMNTQQIDELIEYVPLDQNDAN